MTSIIRHNRTHACPYLRQRQRTEGVLMRLRPAQGRREMEKGHNTVIERSAGLWPVWHSYAFENVQCYMRQMSTW